VESCSDGLKKKLSDAGVSIMKWIQNGRVGRMIISLYVDGIVEMSMKSRGRQENQTKDIKLLLRRRKVPQGPRPMHWQSHMISSLYRSPTRFVEVRPHSPNGATSSPHYQTCMLRQEPCLSFLDRMKLAYFAWDCPSIRSRQVTCTDLSPRA
jgi:hypothetical protein